MGAKQSVEEECLNNESTDLRLFAVTKVSISGENISLVPSADASGCYFCVTESILNNTRLRFFHVDFKTETETVLDFVGLESKGNRVGISNFVAVASRDEESKFLVLIEESKSKKIAIVLLSANYSKGKVAVYKERFLDFIVLNNRDRFKLHKSSNGNIYAIYYNFEKTPEDITRFSVCKIDVTESAEITYELIFEEKSVDGQWFTPFVDSDALFCFSDTFPINKILKIPLDNSNIATIPVICGCASCGSKQSHSFEYGQLSYPASFNGKVFFAITFPNCSSSLWSFNISSANANICNMTCEQRIQYRKLISSDNPEVYILSDGSSFIYTQRILFQLDLSISNFDNDIGEKSLGKGTYGDVRKGTLTGHGDVAIKIMKCETRTDKRKLLLSAIAEAQKLKSISHSNIIKAIGYRIEQQRFLLFMELMKESVRDKILRSEKKRLDENEALNIFQQALEGLVHLHTLTPKPIVHRDIKCANMLLSNTGAVKLGDFGLVQTISLTSSGSTDSNEAPEGAAGTAFWQAPEVLKDSTSYGRKADVWSLGCSLVEMLTGYPPYSDLGLRLMEWAIKASDGTLSYDPIELVPNSATKTIFLLEKVFRRPTKMDISRDQIENIRPHSWEILAEVANLNTVEPLQQQLMTLPLEEQISQQNEKPEPEHKLDSTQLFVTAMRNLSVGEHERDDHGDSMSM